jgi:hypothetical protein
MGRPSSRQQCLFIETTDGEHVWLDFGTKEEREWLPIVQRYTELAAPQSEDDA